MADVPGFLPLAHAPQSILGHELVLLHMFGATERTTLQTKEEAKTAYLCGWTRYKLASEPHQQEQHQPAEDSPHEPGA